MKNVFRNIGRLMEAAAFAEAGEWDTARQMLPASRSAMLSRIERTFMAVALAEGGLATDAVRVLGMDSNANLGLEDFFSAVGLAGVHVRIGVFAADGPL